MIHSKHSGILALMAFAKIGALKFNDGFDAKTDAPKTAHTRISDRRQSREAGGAIRLIGKLMIGGAQKQELENACKYFMCTLDAVKYQIDLKECRRMLGINELIDKYMSYGEDDN